MKKNRNHRRTAQPLNIQQATTQVDSTIIPKKEPPFVLIATPCYGSKVFQQYLNSVIQFQNEAFRRKSLNYAFSIRGGDSLITRLRNSIVAEFLANDRFTHLLFIDADIGFSAAEVFHLIESDHDIACGLYPLKALVLPDVIPSNIKREELLQKYLRYPFNPINNSFEVRDGFAEVKDAPTGMMCIKREVLLNMIDQYPELKYNPDTQVGMEGMAGTINDYYYNFFDTILSQEGDMKRYLSEDYAFCRLWQRMGGSVHAFVHSKLSHTGLFTYQGDFVKYLEYNYSINEQSQEKDDSKEK